MILSQELLEFKNPSREVGYTSPKTECKLNLAEVPPGTEVFVCAPDLISS